MPRSFIDPDYRPPEKSAEIAFGGNRLDRLSEDRDEGCVAQALDHPDARLFGIAKGRVLVDVRGKTPDGLFSHAALEPFAMKAERMVLLGYEDGAPRLAVPLGIDPEDEAALPEGIKAIDYRSLARQMLLGETGLGMVAQAASLLAWHGSARFCGRCGSATESRIGGMKRSCTGCGSDVFPRVDPVVIMLTVSGDKCLLGRSHHFPPGFYSALAGFVEGGETLEMAVRRETHEESGIRVGRVTYHASQPWPFPHSLMIGCYGEALDDTITRDESELDDCRWFTREEMLAILDGRGPQNEDGSPQFLAPFRFAIAGHLITDWAKGRAGG